jgi:hypothetical protein
VASPPNPSPIERGVHYVSTLASYFIWAIRKGHNIKPLNL